MVIGVGNSLRHDDAAGLAVAGGCAARRRARRGARAASSEGERLGLLELGRRARRGVARGRRPLGRAPGTIHRLDASSHGAARAADRGSSSTHAVGVGEAIELARALDRLPARVVVFGIEGRCFSAGEGLSPPVQAAVAGLAEAVLAEALRQVGQATRV